MNVLVNKQNNIVIVMFPKSKLKYVIKCKEGDKFDFRIGVGVAISKYIDKSPLVKDSDKKKYKFLRENMREKPYYMYCYNSWFYFKEDIIEIIESLIDKEEMEYNEAVISEKVRKAECEIRGINYKPKHIKHKFIIMP